MNRVPSVLVFCPVFDRKNEAGRNTGSWELMDPRTREYLESLSTDSRCTVLVQNHNPVTEEDEPRRYTRMVKNHKEQFNAMREIFLAGDYTHCLIVESDMIPHPDSVDMLLECDADMAFAPYMFRYGDGKSCNILKFRFRDDRNPGEPLTAHGEYLKYAKRGIIDCSGSGFGVTMIKRRVLERLNFRTRDDKPNQFCDWWFIKNVWNQKNWTMKANMNAVAGHVNGDKVLWPPTQSESHS